MKKLICLTMALLLLLTSCGAIQKVESADIFAMDTYMNLRAWGPERKAALEAAEAEIHRLDALLSISSTTGEIFAANRDGAAELSADTAELLTAALEAQELTDGAFDPTMLPLMELWGFTTGEYAVPDDAQIAAALALTGPGRVELAEGSVTLAEGSRLDLGGIAKGYTSDRVTDIMREMGVTSAIVTLGGNVQTVGGRADGDDWRVAIRDPQDASKSLGIVSVRDMAVVTSGGYERFFEQDGVSYHHIIDPETGCPAQGGLSSVTIVCERGVTADLLSTALFVMGLEDAAEFWRSGAYDFEAVLMSADGGLYITSGLAESFETELEYSVIE